MDLQTAITRGSDGTDGNPSTPSGTGSLNPQFVEWLMGFPLEWTTVDDWYPAYRGGGRDVSRD
jgi:hypothetical protein